MVHGCCKPLYMRRKGPFFTVVIGAFLNFAGYALLYMAATGQINPPYWLLLVIIASASNGQCWFETGCMVTSVRNFYPERYAFKCQ